MHDAERGAPRQSPRRTENELDGGWQASPRPRHERSQILPLKVIHHM